jgi:hypothetical protein
MVELNCQGARPRIDLNKTARFRRLALVNSSKVEFSPGSVGAGSATFTAAEMQHNFAIWALKKDANFTQQRHLYYCVRCKQGFSVDDRSGYVTPVDPQGGPIQRNEAAKRLATFSHGPCLAFSGLITGPRPEPTVIPIWSVRGRRFARMIRAAGRMWQAGVGHWGRSGVQNQGSKSKLNAACGQQD